MHVQKLDVVRPVAADRMAMRVFRLADEVVLATWDAQGTIDAPPRLVAVVDGQVAHRPFVTLHLATGSGRTRIFAGLRWPGLGRSGSVLAVREDGPDPDAHGEVPRAHPLRTCPGEAVANFDPAALLDGLEGGARLRVVRLVLELCRTTFRLGDDPHFTANCRRLVAELVPRPEPLRPRVELTRRLTLCAGLLPEALGEVGSVVLIGARVRQNPARPHLTGTAADGRVPMHLVVDRGAGAGELLVVLIGRSGMACRTLRPWARPRAALLPWLERTGSVPPALRDYIARCLAMRAGRDPQAAEVLRTMQLFQPAARRRLLNPAKAVGADVELAVTHGAGGLFLSGWLRDPHGLVAALRVVSPLGGERILEIPTHRFPRPDVEAQYRDSPHRVADPRLGFVAFSPGELDRLPAHHHRVELRLHAGAQIDLVPPPAPLTPAAARDAVLGAVPPPAVTRALLAACLAPPLARLHAAHLATRQAPEVIRFGAAPTAPEVSVLVPLYRNLEFLRFQMAAFAVDPALRQAELILVLDSPEQRDELEHLLAGLHALYDLPVSLAVMSGNYGYAAANNAGAALARGRHLLLLNSDVIPERPGWLRPLVETLEADPQIGAVGPKLLFDDQSLQHAGLYFGRDLKGDWLNLHYHKGLPRDYPPANTACPVPGVTGAALLVRRSLFERVGGLTEDYIIGDYEDSDLCLKLRACGAEIVYQPAAELYHLERRSISQHAGYMRGVASQYNAWLHAQRWEGAMAELMARFGGGA